MTKTERDLIIAQFRVEHALSDLAVALRIESERSELSKLLAAQLDTATQVLKELHQADAARISEICGETKLEPIPEETL